MNEPYLKDRTLSSALRAVAEDESRLGASPSVEARLLVEVQAIARARRGAHLKMYAAAAVLVLAVGTAVWSIGDSAPEPLAAGNVGSAAAAPALPAERTTDFFPLHYSEVPATNAQIVRLEVASTALANFGVEAPDSQNDAARTVLADVIVGADGVARAIRFVWPPSDARRETP